MDKVCLGCWGIGTSWWQLGYWNKTFLDEGIELNPVGCFYTKVLMEGLYKKDVETLKPYIHFVLKSTLDPVFHLQEVSAFTQWDGPCPTKTLQQRGSRRTSQGGYHHPHHPIGLEQTWAICSLILVHTQCISFQRYEFDAPDVLTHLRIFWNVWV